MTFLGLERPVAYGRELIFDPTMANMVLNAQQNYINAAKEEYQQAVKDLKDFNTTWGDFMSPFQKDMDRYNEIVSGVRDKINAAYDQGIDLLRSPEGRLFLTQIQNSANPAELSRMKANAKLGYEYLSQVEKARANDQFDEDYENFLLQKSGLGAFDDFSSAGGKMWNRPAPGIYKDLNSWTHHLFDDMELSYDAELSKNYPGYQAYTKSKDTMNAIVDTNIAELLKTNLGQFQLEKIKSQIPDDYPDKERLAIAELKRRVVDSNWEQGQIKLEADPYALARYNRRMYGGSGSRGSRNTKEDYSYNYLTGVFTRGLTNSFGYDPNTQGEEAADNLLKNQVNFGSEVANSYPVKGNNWRASRELQYVNKFTTWESPVMFAPSIGKTPINKEGGVYMTADDVNRLHSTADIVTNTYGYANTRVNTDRTKIPTPVVRHGDTDEDVWTSNVIMQPYRDVYTSYQKHGSIDSQWKVQLVDSETGKVIGDYWYDLPMPSSANHDIPSLNEWVYDKQKKEWYLPTTKDGKRRDVPKLGVSRKAAGYYETSSHDTNKRLGVTKNDLDTNTSYAEEAISNEPAWKRK